jgi:hypothetical protein
MPFIVKPDCTDDFTEVTLPVAERATTTSSGRPSIMWMGAGRPSAKREG